MTKKDAPAKNTTLDETLAPVVNFTISTAERVRAAHGPPAFSRRLRHIEDLQAALLETVSEAIGRGAREAGLDGVAAARRELEDHPAVDKPLRELNRLIEAHNRYYPIEANLRLDPTTGDQLERGPVARPWRPMKPVTLGDVIALAACDAASRVGER
jgi:hypothetical protein